MTDFLGVPISGEIPRPYNHSAEQYSAAQLRDEIAAVLAFNGVEAVQWQQHTPNYNDGDPCYFGAYLEGVRWSGLGDADEDSPRAFDIYDLKAALGTLPPGFEDAYRTLQHNISADHYDRVLEEHFGDPARVTVFPNRIEVEEFEVEY
jgi:hypothetical protein